MKYKKLLTNFFKKPLFAQIMLLLVLAMVLALFKISFDLAGNNTPGRATLAINFETEKRLFEGEVVKNMTMLDALNAAVSAGKIKLNYAIDRGGNVKIMELDGHINGIGGKYLVFYLNSKKISTEDLNRQALNNGDKIEIRNE